jgi:3-oxoacyl-[acyl-carrier-protein] synthase-3
LQAEPPLSLDVKTAIGAPGAIHFDVVNACAGMLTGVMILDDFIRRGEICRGMVVSGECISDIALNAAADMDCLPNDQIASLTLGDAGAAVILERTDRDGPGFEAFEFRTVAAFDDLCIGRPRQAGPGFEMVTKAKELQETALREIVPLLRELLSEHGGDISRVQYFIPHQTSSKAIELGTAYLCHELGVAPPRHVAIIVDEFGNTASTTHFLALHRLLCDGKLEDGDRVLLLCYASGIVVGYSLLMLDGMAESYGCND